MSFENICSVQHEACLMISPQKQQQKGQCWCFLGRKPASEGQCCSPGLLEELGHSWAHRSVNETVILWVGLSTSINLKMSLKKCSLVLNSPLWPESFFFLNLHFKKVYKLFWHQKKEKREEEVDANGQVPVRRKGIFQAWAHSQKVREFLSDSSRKKDHSTLNATVIVEKPDSRHLISMSCHNWLWSRKYLVFWKYCLTKNWFLRWHGEESIY